MTHDNVYGFCESKCKVEVPTKVEFEELDSKLNDEVQARGQAIADVMNTIDERLLTRRVISITDGQTLLDEVKNMNVGDELIIGAITVVPDTDGEDDGNIVMSMGSFVSVEGSRLAGNCPMVVGKTDKTNVNCWSLTTLTDSFMPFAFSLGSDGKLYNDFYKVFTPSRISKIEGCYIIKHATAEGGGAINLTYEPWTFTLDDGTTVTKEVCIK